MAMKIYDYFALQYESVNQRTQAEREISIALRAARYYNNPSLQQLSQLAAITVDKINAFRLENTSDTLSSPQPHLPVPSAQQTLYNESSPQTKCAPLSNPPGLQEVTQFYT